MDINSSGLVKRLKGATALQHAALEALPCQQTLLTEECCIHDYSQVLLAYAHAISAVDLILESYPWPHDCIYFPRLPLLNQDLRILFHLWNDMPSSCEQSIHLNLWGVRYVIEGMALGTHWMLKKSPIFQNTKTKQATAFFQYKKTNWLQFCGELEKACGGAAVQQSVVDSACWMFQQFHEALAEKSKKIPSCTCVEHRLPVI